MGDHNIQTLLEALSESFSDEELLVSTLQADIATTISSVRVSKGLSQGDLAKMLNVSQGLISRWEGGDVNFTLETLARISLKLGIAMRSPYVPDRIPRTTDGKITTIHQNGDNNSFLLANSHDQTWQIQTGEPKEM